MLYKELKQTYDNLLKDEDFDKLDLGLKNPNIFQILSISKNEIRHSNFLSWLLDPNQSHKLGDIFLKRFLREVFSSEKFDNIDQADVEGLNFSDVEVLREWKNIDILIKLNDIVVCIENKVLSKEHSNQLKKYKNIVENEFPKHQKTFVFLTPDGYESVDENETYQSVSYEFIVSTLERIVTLYGESMNSQVKNYIKDYITIIKRELMGTDKLTELSKKIYANHKELFDFIYDHKPDVLDDFRLVFQDEIKKRGWVLGSQSRVNIRFSTDKIKALTYISKNPMGWRDKESFLFEIGIYPDRDRIYCRAVVSPADSSYDSDRLSEMLSKIEGFKKAGGKKWRVNYSKTEKFPFSKSDELTKEEIAEKFNKILDNVAPVLQRIEDMFIENEKELIKMKNV